MALDLTARLSTYKPWLELPDEELRRVARDELKEPVDDDLARVQLGEQVLQALRDAQVPLASGWLSYSPEGYAVAYLRWAKWDVKKAVNRIKAMNKWFAAAKQGDGLAFRGKDFKESVFDVGFVRELGRPAKAGGLIQLMRPARGTDKIPDPTVLLRYNIWVLRRTLASKRMQVCGMAVLETFEGTTFMGSVRFTRQINSVMSLQMKFMNECAPFRLQTMCMVHEPSFFSFLYAFAKPFMSQKMRQRIRFYGNNLARLHEEVADASLLPADFGGTNPDDGAQAFEALVALEAEEDAAAAAAAGVVSGPQPGSEGTVGTVAGTVAADQVTLE